MKILFIWPKYPNTFWSFKYALPFISKKAAFPPLGLLTVSSLLPKEWDKKLIDMNVENLTDDDIKRSDMVFVSAMIVQKESAREVLKRCRRLGVKTVAGGPLFTTGSEDFENEVDCFVLNEAEATLPLFLADLKNGFLKPVYRSPVFPNITGTPVPDWSLLKFKHYSSMSIQYSRGCPFNCEFCDIVVMNGRVPRTKTKEQVVSELESLYTRGWRGAVFFVDDNFIGNKIKLQQEILPAIIEWMEKKKYPFSFNTEASINLSDDEKTMQMMVRAGFDTVFVGIETPDENSLQECGKFQNKNRNLIDSIKRLQKGGLQVQAGFIVGFDSDTPSIFDRQINFIQRSGIVTAMVGILGALPKTRLYQRLEKEGRLIKNTSGNNVDGTINFVPKMGADVLSKGHRRILKTIYSPDNYYARIRTFLKNYQLPKKSKIRIKADDLKAFLKSIWFQGIWGKERPHYWQLLFWSLFNRPRLFPLAVTLSIYGVHFRKISENNP